MRTHLIAAGLAALVAFASSARAQIESGSLSVHWSEGAQDCKAHPEPPLQVHAYNPDTFILRENLCSTFEAPFLYLLVGSSRALLIDTGDVANPKQMPLAETVLSLLPKSLPLLVVHTHRHLDHRAGDAQFAHRPNVQVVGYDIDSVKRFYGFTHWPDGIDHLDLGGRIVDVLPTPGHNETHVAFYDRNTALFFSGDFMMPARLLIEDESAEAATVMRAADFVRHRPIAAVLGGHIEEDANGNLFDWESQYHPGEHGLAMSKVDLLALPAAFARFNGLYGSVGKFTFLDQMRELILLAIGAIVVLAVLIATPIWYLRRRRRRARAS
jgi:hydroxyacylglutathione hydrolase